MAPTDSEWHANAHRVNKQPIGQCCADFRVAIRQLGVKIYRSVIQKKRHPASNLRGYQGTFYPRQRRFGVWTPVEEAAGECAVASRGIRTWLDVRTSASAHNADVVVAEDQIEVLKLRLCLRVTK
jgi:hypothetical protein